MPISLSCPGCSTRLKAPDAAAGKKIKCPKCQRAIAVAVPDTEPDFEEVEDEVARPKSSTKAAVNDDHEKPKRTRAKSVTENEDGDDGATEDNDPKPKKKRKGSDPDDEEPRPKKKKRSAQGQPPWLLIGGGVGLFVIVVVGALAAIGTFSQKPPVVTENKEPSKDNTPSPSKDNTPSPGNGKSDFRGTAESLTSEFERDTATAKLKFAGQTAEVTGPYQWTRLNNFEGEPEYCIILRGVSTSGVVGYAPLVCKITEQQFNSDPRLRSLARGQNVTVRGKVQSFPDATLTDCTIVTVGPSTAISTTLEEIEVELSKKANDLGRFKDRDAIVRVKIGRDHPKFDGYLMRCYAASPSGSRVSFRFWGSRWGEAYDTELTAIELDHTVIFLAQIEKLDTGTVEFGHTRLIKSLPEGLKLPDDKK